MKFKVGDKVKFVGDYRKYSTCNGKRLEDFIKENKNILYVSTVNTSYTQVKGSTFWCFHDGELELTEYTYKDLKKSPIGTKITFEDGIFNIRKNEKWFTGECSREIADLKSLKDNYGKRGKIIKIEEPTYQTVYEYKPEILDEAEKRYLRGVIRPFRSKVLQIVKKYDPIKELEFIRIIIKDDISLEFPSFSKNTMYENMKTDKKYTLEELGL